MELQGVRSAFAIAIEDLGEGLWRLKTDKSGKIRKSEEPQLWS